MAKFPPKASRCLLLSAVLLCYSAAAKNTGINSFEQPLTEVTDSALVKASAEGQLGLRQFKSVLTYSCETPLSGTINLAVCVDEAGNVIEAEYSAAGSTIQDTLLSRQCIAWARQIRFSLDSVDRQCGIMSFHFSKRESISDQINRDEGAATPILPFAKNGGLAGRKLVGRPRMVDNTQKTGKVVVEICVDAAGNVISASYEPLGSTTDDEELKSKAIAWAMQHKFAAGDSAKECGTIAFTFAIK